MKLMLQGYYDLFVKSFYWLLLHQFSTNPLHESMLQDNVNFTCWKIFPFRIHFYANNFTLVVCSTSLAKQHHTNEIQKALIKTNDNLITLPS